MKRLAARDYEDLLQVTGQTSLSRMLLILWDLLVRFSCV
jgi:hypothetical protein